MRYWPQIVEILLVAGIGLWSSTGLNAKANRIALALERQAAALERAYPAPVPPYLCGGIEAVDDQGRDVCVHMVQP